MILALLGCVPKAQALLDCHQSAAKSQASPRMDQFAVVGLTACIPGWVKRFRQAITYRNRDGIETDDKLTGQSGESLDAPFGTSTFSVCCPFYPPPPRISFRARSASASMFASMRAWRVIPTSSLQRLARVRSSPREYNRPLPSLAYQSSI